MPLHINDEGVWTQAQTVYVKRSGTWRKARNAYVKRSGVWTQAYEYDVVPCSPPTLTVDSVVDHLKVGVRLPEAYHVTDLAMVRVLHSRDGFPATPLSSGYIRTADKSYPNEPWSDFSVEPYFGQSIAVCD